ncbi:1660_t:CDS:2 [Cetraspora pellucida]|uniref:1660_t:CDS:1 n=1 Tax=Cetraspora pellucida TaxID=1433469 RepID=A0ACA9PGH4_9GLOM|nr:1660_t:CDS:2 [Cetraspora pellucida]
MSGKKKEITRTGTTLRSQEQKRKTVFKSVLNSPYTVKWPEVSLEGQQTILEELCNILSVVGDYKQKKVAYRRNLRLSRRKSVNNSNSQKDEEKVNETLYTMDVDCISENTESLMTIDDNETATSSKSISLPPPPPPPILSCIVIGINDVTKHLEQTINPDIKTNFKRKYAQGLSHSLISTNPNNQLVNPSPIVIQNESLTPLRMIFVCKADISSPHLCAHLPIMSSIARNVLLVPLPLGAEELISNKVGIKRASCIGVKIKTPEFDGIYKLVKDKVGPVNAPWLTPFKSELSKKRKGIEEDEIIPSTSIMDDFIKTTCNEYVPTQIKQLITSAPIKSKTKQKKNKGKNKSN